MQRLKRTIPITSPLFVIVGFFFWQSVWADDVEEFAQSGSLSDSEAIYNATTCFATVKQNGTVWLRTQQAMDTLISLEKQENSAQAAHLAQSIADDCRLIRNQHALEQARYLLSTLELKGVDDRELDAIRVQLQAADGDASLALAKNLARELP